MSPVPTNITTRCFDDFEQQRYGYHDRKFQYNHRQEPDQRRYSHASQALPSHNNDPTSIVSSALENFTAQWLGQPLAHAAPGSIQEFDGDDKAATIPWLDQVELVLEKTGNDPMEVSISKKGISPR